MVSQPLFNNGFFIMGYLLEGLNEPYGHILFPFGGIH